MQRGIVWKKRIEILSWETSLNTFSPGILWIFSDINATLQLVGLSLNGIIIN
jgi:hypothetical protein